MITLSSVLYLKHTQTKNTAYARHKDRVSLLGTG